MKTYSYDATVDRWVDGDTVWLDVDLGFRVRLMTDFRLIGVDTPEHGKPGFAEATAFNNAAAPPGTKVSLASYRDPDKYGRWLGAVTVDGADTSINAQLVAAKLAVPYFGGKK